MVVAVLRTGKLIGGRQLDPAHMPWPAYVHFTDDEIKALWLYLKSLSPKPYGENK
jgi:hypothetical protein